MSRLSRSLIRSMKKELTVWDKLYEFWDSLTQPPDWYYTIKNYLSNVILFNKLAVHWRSWDSCFTVDVLIELLKQHAHKLDDGNIRHSRNKKALVMAYKLNQAYNYSCVQDKGYMYYAKKYPITFNGNQLILHYGASDKTLKLIDVASKRVDNKEASLKKEAWEYVHKYIEYIWS